MPLQIASAYCRARFLQGQFFPARLKEELARRDKPFHHLQRIKPWRVPGETLEFRMLASQEAVRQAAKTLKNCAADYIPNVVAQRCALVGLFDTGVSKNKIIAMGELTPTISDQGDIVATFKQRARECNRSLTKKQNKLFRKAAVRLSASWTEVASSDMQNVLPPSKSSLEAMKDLSCLAKVLLLRKLARTTTVEGYGALQTVMRDFLRSALKGPVPDALALHCVAFAAWVQDPALVEPILDAKISNNIKTKLLELPMPFVATALHDAMVSAGQAGNQEQLTRIVSSLEQARVSTADLKTILEAARHFDMEAKLTVLLSSLPFKPSDLVGAVTPSLVSAAQAGNQEHLTRIVVRLEKASVSTAEDLKSILEAACHFDTQAKLRVLLSKLPFEADGLLGALTEPLLRFSRQQGEAASRIVKTIGVKLSASGVRPADVHAIIQDGNLQRTAAQLRVLTCGLSFRSSTVKALVPAISYALISCWITTDRDLVRQIEDMNVEAGVYARLEVVLDVFRLAIKSPLPDQSLIKGLVNRLSPMHFTEQEAYDLLQDCSPYVRETVAWQPMPFSRFNLGQLTVINRSRGATLKDMLRSHVRDGREADRPA